MIALREYVTVANHRIVLDLSKDFNCDEVEVIIIPKEDKGDWDYWSEKEIDNIGKIGLVSSSFEDDDEDYSKW